jgi:hypothetical protein
VRKRWCEIYFIVQNFLTWCWEIIGYYGNKWDYNIIMIVNHLLIVSIEFLMNVSILSCGLLYDTISTRLYSTESLDDWWIENIWKGSVVAWPRSYLASCLAPTKEPQKPDVLPEIRTKHQPKTSQIITATQTPSGCM